MIWVIHSSVFQLYSLKIELFIFQTSIQQIKLKQTKHHGKTITYTGSSNAGSTQSATVGGIVDVNVPSQPGTAIQASSTMG